MTVTLAKTFLLGGDRLGWALDMDKQLTRLSLPPTVVFTNPINNDVVHTIHWNALVRLPRELLVGRRVLSHFHHASIEEFSRPAFMRVSELVQLWIVRSAHAKQVYDELGLSYMLIPYAYDPTVFFPIPKADPRLMRLRADWGIPQDRYLIGSFQRDTEGKDLKSPKMIKGPDRFLEVVKLLHQCTGRIHILLAGPRRFWLRNKLQEEGIPFTFVGKKTRDDDLRVKLLSRESINLLYNLLDVYLITSRLEGGPQAVLEAAATRCKILSTDVGCGPDLLHPDCIIASTGEAVQKIEKDIVDGILASTLDFNARSVERCRPEALKPLWEEAYRLLMTLPPLTSQQVRYQPGIWQVVWNRARGQ